MNRITVETAAGRQLAMEMFEDGKEADAYFKSACEGFGGMFDGFCEPLVIIYEQQFLGEWVQKCRKLVREM